MTQAYSDEVGARKFDSNNKPVAKTYPNVEGNINSMVDRKVTKKFDVIEVTSADGTFEMAAPDKGKVIAVRFVNGATACDGTNGLKIVITNKTNSNAVVASAGFGSATNAAAASDKDTAVAAYETSTVKTTSVEVCNYEDTLLGTITRDGTAVTGVIEVVYAGSNVGRS